MTRKPRSSRWVVEVAAGAGAVAIGVAWSVWPLWIRVFAILAAVAVSLGWLGKSGRVPWMTGVGVAVVFLVTGLQVLVLVGEVDPEAIWAWCDERLPYFAVPRYVELVDELPKTPTAKVRKIELREAGVTPRTADRGAAPAGRGLR